MAPKVLTDREVAETFLSAALLAGKHIQAITIFGKD
jgi:hypothetical protein